MPRWQDVEHALEQWREAERRASRFRPSSVERRAADRDVAVWRAAYQVAVGRAEINTEDGSGGERADLRAAVATQAGRR